MAGSDVGLLLQPPRGDVPDGSARARAAHEAGACCHGRLQAVPRVREGLGAGSRVQGEAGCPSRESLRVPVSSELCMELRHVIRDYFSKVLSERGHTRGHGGGGAPEERAGRELIFKISTSDRTHARERTREEHSRRAQHEQQPASIGPSVTTDHLHARRRLFHSPVYSSAPTPIYSTACWKMVMKVLARASVCSHSSARPGVMPATMRSASISFCEMRIA